MIKARRESNGGRVADGCWDQIDGSPVGGVNRSAVRAAGRVCDLQLPGPVEQVGTRGSAGRATGQHEQSKAVLKPVVRWESGWVAVGSRRWQQFWGRWAFQGAVQVLWCRCRCRCRCRCQVVDGRGWCSRSTCLGRGTGLDWTGLGDWGTGDWRQQSCCQGPARRDGAQDWADWAGGGKRPSLWH
jgi:hypothetical protein